MANHVHVENAGAVETLDHVFWWDTNSRNEESSASVDDDSDELVKLALCIVVAKKQSASTSATHMLVLGRVSLRLPGTTTNLGQQ